MSILSRLRGIYYTRDVRGNHWYTIGREDANWDLGDPLQALLNNPVTFSCVDFISDILSQVRYGIEGVEQSEANKHPVIKLLNKPNFFQSKQDFIRESTFFEYAHGWVYERPLSSTGFEDQPQAMYALNPKNITYNKDFPTRLAWTGDELNELKKRQFKYTEAGKSNLFDITEVIPFYDIASGLSEDFLLRGPSRLKAIRKPMKNIDNAMESKQKSLQKAGRFIVSGSKQGAAITRPMEPDEKLEIENSLGKYGNNNIKGDIAVTNSQVEVHSLHIPVSQLGIPESVMNDAMIIINTFGMTRELYTLSSTGSTYENQKEALISFIQNKMQAKADNKAQSYTSYFGMDRPLTATFDHMAVMQHIEDKKADKALKMAMAIEKLQGAGVDPYKFFEEMGINIEQS